AEVRRRWTSEALGAASLSERWDEAARIATRLREDLDGADAATTAMVQIDIAAFYRLLGDSAAAASVIVSANGLDALCPIERARFETVRSAISASGNGSGFGRRTRPTRISAPTPAMQAERQLLLRASRRAPVSRTNSRPEGENPRAVRAAGDGNRMLDD